MIRIVTRFGLSAVVTATSLGAMVPASAAQGACGKPGAAKVYANSMGDRPICSTAAGGNPFSGTGVYRVESGQWTVTLKAYDDSTFIVRPSQHRAFAEPVHVQYVFLTAGPRA